ncbi:FAD-linked oxidoreductase [Fomitiporia mediterranea MF3/22]|uniref:FAD-linked oxidoreductase n=1 Tax=Fomitiporia mediterranea (strain MF3/22) TaxID=694068 RepID=UPI0004408ECA|nr:FAD-linked oxidoreductase [Fomitiporia mediterranea MF3/22]EJD04539.1 FAD-linked oxidoreductase [Fomitiporia mediterranea MF3/22]
MILLACRKAISSSYSSSFSLNAVRRFVSTTSTVSRPGNHVRSRRTQIGAVALTGALGSAGYVYFKAPVLADVGDMRQDVEQEFQRRPTPLGVLFRSYIVYAMCSIPILVDYSPSILTSLLSVPGVKHVTEAFVRATFFSQFVGGDTALETVPLLERLRAENKGALFGYSVEVDEDEAAGKAKAHGHESVQLQPVHKRIIEEIIRCIDVAADFEDQRERYRNNVTSLTGRRTWVAVKLTALLPDAQALINFSKHLVDTRPPPARPVCFPGSPRPTDFLVFDLDPLDLPETNPLTRENLDDLRELKSDLFRVCERAKARGVKIIIDAEHSWYQPAIDAYQRALMAEFNRLPGAQSRVPSIVPSVLGQKLRLPALRTGQEEVTVQPLIYGTFQAYLRRTPEHLAQSLSDAEAGNYALGVKLVRGAYHPFEAVAHKARKFVNSEDKAVVSSNTGLSSPSISPEALPPVWENKEETDACYNACARMLIGRVAAELAEVNARNVGYRNTDSRDESLAGGTSSIIPKLGILFGTHNWGSCELILEALVSEGLAVRKYEGNTEVIRIADNAAERITLGQLYGMRDALTNYLVDKTRSTEPFVIKYVPYGKLSEVMPYLGRRAIENKSVLGSDVAREERRRAGSEIAKRFRSIFA